MPMRHALQVIEDVYLARVYGAARGLLRMLPTSADALSPA